MAQRIFKPKRLVTVFSTSFSHFDTYFPDWEKKVINSPDELEANDLLILHGGGDIHPSYYNEIVAGASVSGSGPTPRDMMENSIIDVAIAMKIPIFGICRGAQWLAIKAGGSLWQDIQNHPASPHVLRILEDKEWFTLCNSAHHQMMRLANIPKEEYELLATAPTTGTTKKAQDVKTYGGPMDEDPEIVFFNKINGFGIQGHPEWMSSTHPLVNWCMDKSLEMFDIPLENNNNNNNA